MSIKPVCDKCKKELEKPGGLAFSPPDDIEKASEVIKYHLCAECWEKFKGWILD